MAIKIEITGDTPLEALASVTAFGMRCLENREVSDAAGAIIDRERCEKSKAESPVETIKAAIDATLQPEAASVPLTPPGAPISQSQDGAAADASSPATSHSNITPSAGVPLASAPSFTLEQISKAGADLIADSNKLPELRGLLQQFNVSAVTQLPADQYGAFATALRGLGAKI